MVLKKLSWLGWLLRYWVLGKYRRPVFVCAVLALPVVGAWALLAGMR